MEFNIKNMLNAANYEDLCGYSIIPPENKVFVNDILEKNTVIFCKTDFLGHLFENITRSSHSYHLITHHSDYAIDEYLFSQKPFCIKKWFAINPTFKNEKLIAIPLGLKTHKGIYLEEVYKTSWFAENIDYLKNNPKEFKLYCNWNPTNIHRNTIIETLKKNNINFTHENNKSFEEYATSMSKHRFVVSPPGNGIDCHRTWESLYLGCIPIVIKNYIYDNWQDLPILQVNDYSEINNELLNSFTKKTFNYEKLSIEYWANEIKNIL